APDIRTGTTLKRGETDVNNTNANRHPHKGIAPGLLAVLIVAAAALVWVIGVPAVRIVRRQQRRKRAGDEPTARVLVSWAEANDALALAGAGRQASETLEEHARRAGPVAHLEPDARRALTSLAGHAEAASYG